MVIKMYLDANKITIGDLSKLHNVPLSSSGGRNVIKLGDEK